MEISVRETNHTRSVERRWNVAGAEPIASHHSPGTTFAPALVSIWWMISDGKADGHRPRYNIYAWPEDRLSHVSQQWSGLRDRPYSADMPDWVRELADGLHTELEALVEDDGL